MKRVRVTLSSAGLAVSAFAIVSVVGLSAQEGLHSDRLCKPVMPQFEVVLTSSEVPTDGYGLLVWYNEKGASPFEWEAFNDGLRTELCTTKGTSCIGSRARYEVRHEGARKQSVLIRSNANGSPYMIGGVQWFGPAYPDRVQISCNLDEKDPRKACRVDGLDYAPNPKTSGKNGSSPPSGISRHDQCQPKPTSIVAMAR